MLLKTFIAALIVIPVLDFIWLGLIASGFYTARMTEVARLVDGKLKPVYWAAFAVYLLLALGLSFFADRSIQEAQTWWEAFLVSAVFGFVVYGVYDFTNHATLRQWPLSLLTADILWGAFVCGLSGLAAYVLIHRFA